MNQKIVAQLRTKIARYEQDEKIKREEGEDKNQPFFCFGDEGLDQDLPEGGLAFTRLHEVLGADVRDGPAAVGFLCALLARWFRCRDHVAPILWCHQSHKPHEFGLPYAPGLAAFGLNPDQLIIFHATRDEDVLWAMEEGLRCEGLAAVVGQVGDKVSLTASRRLNLSAKMAGCPAFLLRKADHKGASAAFTRWRVGAHRTVPALMLDEKETPFTRPQWQVDLLRFRGGFPKSWTVMWNEASHSFAVASQMASRPFMPAAAEQFKAAS